MTIPILTVTPTAGSLTAGSVVPSHRRDVLLMTVAVAVASFIVQPMVTPPSTTHPRPYTIAVGGVCCAQCASGGEHTLRTSSQTLGIHMECILLSASAALGCRKAKALVGSLAIAWTTDVLTAVERPIEMMRIPALRILDASSTAAGSPPRTVARPSLSRIMTGRAPERALCVNNCSAACSPHCEHVLPLDGALELIALLSSTLLDVSGCNTVAVLSKGTRARRAALKS